jgi:DNA-directed RNA polymerase subunit RPC12/RpoP
MDGIIWFFLALAVALIAVGVVAAGRRRRVRSLEQDLKRCAHCETPMSMRRVSLIQSLSFKGGWMCPHCGNRIKSGRGVPKAA